MAFEIWRHGNHGAATTQGARKRKQPIAQSGIGLTVRHHDIKRHKFKKVVGLEHKRACVEYAIKTYKIRSARACKLMSYSRTTLYYKKKMPAKDQAIKELIDKHLRYNSGRTIVTAQIQHHHQGISASKIRRVYTQQGYSLYRRIKSKRIKRAANPITVPLAANQEWAIDFMSDALSNGRRIRTLNIIDPYNRKCLGIHIRHNLPTTQVIQYLTQIIETVGKPASIRTDNGPEFTSKQFQLWLHHNKIKWNAIQPGCPQENAIIERMNRTYREAVLDASVFKDLAQAQKLTDEWLKYYNEQRPHQSLSYKTPDNYAA